MTTAESPPKNTPNQERRKSFLRRPEIHWRIVFEYKENGENIEGEVVKVGDLKEKDKLICDIRLDNDETITVDLSVLGGTGQYEYRYNDRPWQTSNVFSGLENGIQLSFEARQINGCSNIVSASAIGLSFPAFFTPNGDGFNDFWNIPGLRDQIEAQIFIFDRYGKLIKRIFPSQAGWDGFYNGKRMPSQDYWFRVEFEDLITGNRLIYKNHFTLKR